jgi:hypothetical protein
MILHLLLLLLHCIFLLLLLLHCILLLLHCIIILPSPVESRLRVISHDAPAGMVSVALTG